MKVKELIAILQVLPPDLPVGYVNCCADDGREFSPVNEARVRDGRNRKRIGEWAWGLGDCPSSDVVELS